LLDLNKGLKAEKLQKQKLSIYLYNVYRNPNVGLFLKVSERALLIPYGYPERKGKLMAEMLKVNFYYASAGGGRLLGPLLSINTSGALITKFATDDEIISLEKSINCPVERLDSIYTSAGNLLLVNDYGGIASPILSDREVEQASRVLKIKLIRMPIAGYFQVGAVGVATNKGALLHPMASEEELKKAREILGVDVDVGSINGGVPFVASGIVGNTNGLIVGKSTTGPELMIISRVFKFESNPVKHVKILED
jgi:translation initiation factor eIF-6, putative